MLDGGSTHFSFCSLFIKKWFLCLAILFLFACHLFSQEVVLTTNCSVFICIIVLLLTLHEKDAWIFASLLLPVPLDILLRWSPVNVKTSRPNQQSSMFVRSTISGMCQSFCLPAVLEKGKIVINLQCLRSLRTDICYTVVGSHYLFSLVLM